MDAAIAAQMVLTLVEPQSSGIGGGGFLMFYDGKSRALSFYDGRETAPARATENMFLNADGTPWSSTTLVAGGLSVGTPGVLRMLEQLHREHGKLPWARLFDDAIRLSEQGFAGVAAARRLDRRPTSICGSPATARLYFYDDNSDPMQAGSVLKNPALAASLRLDRRGRRRCLL